MLYLEVLWENFLVPVASYYHVCREENELIMQLKGCTPGHRIPVGLLVHGREGLENGEVIALRLFVKSVQCIIHHC